MQGWIDLLQLQWQFKQGDGKNRLGKDNKWREKAGYKFSNWTKRGTPEKEKHHDTGMS